MSEEIVFHYAMNANYLKRGSVNQQVIAQLEIKAHDDFVQQHPETFCDVILVVDTSSSMDEPFAKGHAMTKRAGVLQALQAMVPAMKAEDTLSMICYDSNTYLEMDRIQGSDQQVILKKLQTINNHSGATDFEKAFKAALKILTNCRNAAHKVIFLTDGNATQGSLSAAHQSNQAIAAKACSVDCLGVGEDFNFKEMQRFTAVSNGTTELLDAPATAESLFRALMNDAQHSLINNTVLRLILESGSRDLEIYQFTPEIRYFPQNPSGRGGLDCRINIQTVSHQYSYQYIISARMDLPAAATESHKPMLRARLDYDIPVLKKAGLSQDIHLGVDLADDAAMEEHKSEVDDAYLECTLARRDLQVTEAADKNDWKQVALLLGNMKKDANKLGLNDKAIEYERRIQLLRKQGVLSQDDLNRIGRASSRSSKKFNRPANHVNLDDLY